MGGDAFIDGGFRKSNKPERFEKHVGGIKSAHNLAYEKFLLGQGEKVKEVGDHALENAPGNCQMTSPPIQKDIINCCAKETTKFIIEELGDDYFVILADESSDVSQKEQIALVLRFVNKDSGKVMERFLGIVHVGDTNTLSLKDAILSLLVEHSLSPSMIRGQVSCKRREMIRDIQAQELAQALEVGEILSGSSLNQELGLKRPGDIR
ncbi:uncharacterized protein LOC110728322 [Chenopodium quinoa]|uniref:uncharacterized protein LOC110728322 n=1 Tax=Chenopodium quinoa TaxID=63459 RepID=UPI000B78ACF4|nr:uncharacterized protein LOC110728322 [Chenopodium quinoa]